MRELRPWLRLILKRPWRLLLGGMLILATLLSGIALLAVSGWFITETALTGLLLAAGMAASINLYVPGGAIRFFAVSRAVSRYLERVYNHDTVLRLLTDIRVALFRRLAASSRRLRNELTGAQWLSRLTNDVDALDTLYLRLIAPTALAGLVTVLMLVLTAILFDLATAFIVAGLLVAAFVVSSGGVYLRTRELAYRQSDRQESLRTAVIEHLEGFAELTAAGRTGKHGAWLMRQAYQVTSAQTRTDTRTGWHLAGTHFLVNLTAVISLWLGLGLYHADEVSGPVLVLLPIALLGLCEVYAMLPDAFGRLGATEASANRLNRDCAGSADGDPPAQPPSRTGVALHAKNLAVKHPGHAMLLTHFELELKAGERLGILGHSGSGKSSLADTIAGLLAPAQGSLSCLPGVYLTQRTVLFEDTLRANLLLGAPEASDTELWRMLEMVELADRFAAEPDQLDTWLGSDGNRLSGGEARRVALARVLLNRAAMVILDEPFTGLDSETRSRISKRMDVYLEGRTVISLAHGPDALPGTDRVIYLTG
ncbi:thiol reductant ABC exporter subunit CydC [Marinobacter sp. M-5]|uniref:thiol reductant ABC exporter subunit CydC n=1 Tax=Marinobacter sp. M-5 TaxID=3081089 RepID=UPI00293CC08C|nr:thiol reductant ABC exporter subunit CydC [Marinobacter sp. M-5]MDV3503660.1 thiol reductant ABC exporter subunit CydC [Marinobacter sp. M-5]